MPVRWPTGLVAVALTLGRPGAAVQASPSDSTLVAYASAVWKESGRASIASNAGLQATADGWRPIAGWRGGSAAAKYLYSTQPVVDGGLALAEATGDTALLSDLASYYLAALRWTVPLAMLPERWSTQPPRPDLLLGGAPGTRTFAWQDPRGAPGECALCNAQFLAPAGHLVLLLAREPVAARSPPARQFLAAYVPLLLHDHLLRFAFAARWDARRPPGLVALWSALDHGWRAPGPHYQVAFRDRDLWLVGTAADLLDAARIDPQEVTLGASADSLRTFLDEGLARLRAAATAVPGGAVGAAGRTLWFQGDYDGHPDQLFADDSAAATPMAPPRVPPTGTTWDMSHFSRLPVVLRRLADARAGLALEFPEDAVLRGSVAQLLGAVWNGDTLRPMLRNYFDGRDGWYRVSYEGRAGFGFPPSGACRAESPGGGCVGASGILGWSRLACAAPAVRKLSASLLALAGSGTAEAVQFRTEKYTLYHQAFAFRTPQGGRNDSLLLFELIGDVLLGEHC